MYFRPNRLARLAFPDATPDGASPDAEPVGRGTVPVTSRRNPGAPDITISVERDTDLVLLDFAFYDCEVQVGPPAAIVPTTSSGTIVVQFPPQAVAEGAYPWPAAPAAPLPVDPPPILSDLSGPSRLVFSLPSGSSIPLPTMTVADLLDWSGWALVVPPVAQVNGPTKLISHAEAGLDQPPAGGTGFPLPTEPTEMETAIEFPYALFLAPVVYASGLPIDGFSTGFAARTAPLVSAAGVVDLWSASLVGSRVDPVSVEYVPAVSAVWADDYSPSPFVAGPANATPETDIDYSLPPPK
jgi:hypothetical protein